MSKQKRSHSSQLWLRRQQSDFYVQAAQKRNLRSRAGIKLEELQQRERLFRPGMIVVDLGAAPGGWSQMIQPWIGARGRLIALDLLPMNPLPNVEFLQGDFTENQTLKQLEQMLGEASIDVVASDMAPNFTGIRSVDQARSMLCAELALEFAQEHLTASGALLVKCFHGAGLDQYQASLKKQFHRVVCRKPQASRSESREVYIVASRRRDSR